MTDKLNSACTLAAATHRDIGVLMREGQPVFYAMLDNRDMSAHGFGDDFIRVEHSDIEEVLAYLPKEA
jgi:hypothetical protein